MSRSLRRNEFRNKRKKFRCLDGKSCDYCYPPKTPRKKTDLNWKILEDEFNNKQIEKQEKGEKTND